MSTKIEWTEETWNVVTGCTRISEGCEGCYIERTPPFRMGHRKFDGPQIGATTGVQLHEDRLSWPLRWRKPRRIFVCSLADLFHDEVPTEFIAQVFGVMAVNEEHTYQVLTKRPARMRALLRSEEFRWRVNEEMLKRCGSSRRSRHDVCPVCHWNTSGNCASEMSWPLSNVWLGVSTESQKWADLRIPALLDTPAAVRWISAEPLLGPVRLAPEWLAPAGAACWSPGYEPDTQDHAALAAIGRAALRQVRADRGEPAPTYLDWVVVGGETGPGSRPMHPGWARSLRDQCASAGTPYFFKQHGDWAPLGPLYEAADESDYDEVDNAHMDAVGLEVRGYEVAHLEPTGHIAREYQPMDGTWLMARVGKKQAGRELDKRTHDEYPTSAVPCP